MPCCFRFMGFFIISLDETPFPGQEVKTVCFIIVCSPVKSSMVCSDKSEAAFLITEFVGTVGYVPAPYVEKQVETNLQDSLLNLHGLERIFHVGIVMVQNECIALCNPSKDLCCMISQQDHQYPWLGDCCICVAPFVFYYTNTVFEL